MFWCGLFLALIHPFGTTIAHVDDSYVDFEGPFLHEAFMGGLVELPCFTSIPNQRLMLNRFTSTGSYLFSLKWVHRRFNRLVDPWTGDGRRSYVDMAISNAQDGLAGSMGIFRIPSVPGVSLQILATNPSDAGQYACLLSKKTFDKGLVVDLEHATLLSIHSVRVAEGKVFSKEVEPNDADDADDVTMERKGSFFDAWTWQIYSFTNADPESAIFDSESSLVLK